MKTLISLLTSGILLLSSAEAQISQNFDQGFASLTSNCWQITSGVSYTTTSGEVINGTGSAYIDPVSSNSVESISTPFLNMNSTSLNVSLKYKLSSKLANNATRSINVGITDKNGVFTLLQNISMDKNTPTSVITLNATYTLAATGVYRLTVQMSSDNGDGNSKVIVDDLFASASPYYGPTSACNPAAVANNDSRSSSTMSTVSGNVLTNDNIPADNDTYSAVLVSAPSQGTLVLSSNGTFSYTPVAGYTGGTITFSYRVADNGYTPTTSNVATVTINYASLSMLPIKILTFDATKQSSSVEISWKVSDNEAGDFFVIEKSVDGKNFSAVTTVETNGMKGTSEYYATDNASAVTAYYRIKTVNRDHSVSYSKVVIVKGEGENAEVKLMNNPATANLNIYYKATSQENATIKVYSISGAQVYRAILNSSAGVNNISVPVQQMQNGSYVLVIESIQGKQAMQFVKN